MTHSPAPPARPAVADYGRMVGRKLGSLALMAAAAVVLLVADVMTGPARVSVHDVLASLLRLESASPSNLTIVWTFRLPVALMAVLVGIVLGVAGAEMQTILNNPLASPYTLGISSAASFGAALALVCGVSVIPGGALLGVPLSAFVFALACAAAIYGLARLKSGSTETLVLGGIALMFLFNAALSFLQYIASEDTAQAIVFWTFGSLQGATWLKLAVIAVAAAVVLPLIARQAWPLTALRLGDARARSLGVDVQRLRLRTLILVSLLTATAVSFTGSIGFIGLVAPHLARRWAGEDQRFLVPLSGLAGAVLLSAASVAGKLVVSGGVLPIGIATALFGVPFFAVMVASRKQECG